MNQLNQFEKIEKKLDDQGKDISTLVSVLKVNETRDKGKKAKIPSKIARQVRKGINNGKIAVAYFGATHKFEFLTGRIENGLVIIGEEAYDYDPGCVYIDPKNKIPVIGIYGWRLTGIDSSIDRFKSRMVGGVEDKELAKQFNITRSAQQTIIRMMKRQETIEQDNKPKKKVNWVWIIIIGAIAIYAITQLL